MITLKVNLDKIDKSRLFKGKQGTYLDLVLIETPDDRFGNDYMCKQSATKEERASGVQLPILGNAKIFTAGQKPHNASGRRAREKPTSDAPPDDGTASEQVPF